MTYKVLQTQACHKCLVLSPPSSTGPSTGAFVMFPEQSSQGFPGGSISKESACSAGDQGLIPGSGRSPGEGNGKPLQYSCLESPMDKGAWWAILHGVAKSQTRLRDFTSLYELFVYFGNYALVSLIICKHFLPFHRLCVYFCLWFPLLCNSL